MLFGNLNFGKIRTRSGEIVKRACIVRELSVTIRIRYIRALLGYSYTLVIMASWNYK